MQAGGLRSLPRGRRREGSKDYIRRRLHAEPVPSPFLHQFEAGASKLLHCTGQIKHPLPPTPGDFAAHAGDTIFDEMA